MALLMNVTSSLTAAAFASARKSFEKIPAGVRTYPSLGRGRNTLGVPTPHSRHGKIWIASGDGRGETRGAPPKSRSADFAHGRSYPDACQPTQGNKCHSPRDVLTHPRRVARNGQAHTCSFAAVSRWLFQPDAAITASTHLNGLLVKSPGSSNSRPSAIESFSVYDSAKDDRNMRLRRQFQRDHKYEASQRQVGGPFIIRWPGLPGAAESDGVDSEFRAAGTRSRLVVAAKRFPGFATRYLRRIPCQRRAHLQ
jgi:hypothetical protein